MSTEWLLVVDGKQVEHLNNDNYEETCRLEFCDRPKKVQRTGLCQTHQNNYLAGKPLEPIKRQSDNSRKYEPGQSCNFEGCDRPVVSKNLCSTHYAQHRKGKRLRPITPKGKKKKTMTYSDTKTCDTCEETKHWTKFVIGTDKVNDECRMCYRERLFPTADPKTAVSLDEVLGMIDQLTINRKDRFIATDTIATESD